MALSKDEILAAIAGMTVLDLSDLIKAMEEKFGVSAAAAAVAVAAPAAGAAAPAVEEKTEFTVVLTAAGEKKVEAQAISLLVAVLVVGVLMRGKTILETAQAAVNTSFLVGLGLLLQLDLFYWRYGLTWNWYLPDLKWGFKYYLDLLQLFATGLAALAAPLLAMAAKVVTDRIPVGRARQAPTG